MYIVVQSFYDSGATDLGYVRLLIADTADTDDDQIFTDAELTALISREGSPLMAAAMALDIIASTELRLSKKITTQDLSTDGPAVAAELRKQAAALRARAREQAVAITEEWGFHTFPVTDARRWPELTERPLSW